MSIFSRRPRAHFRRHPRRRGQDLRRDRLRAGRVLDPGHGVAGPYRRGARARCCPGCWWPSPRCRCIACCRCRSVAFLVLLTLLCLPRVRVALMPRAHAAPSLIVPPWSSSRVAGIARKKDRIRHPDLRFACRALCPHHCRRRNLPRASPSRIGRRRSMHWSRICATAVSPTALLPPLSLAELSWRRTFPAPARTAMSCRIESI